MYALVCVREVFHCVCLHAHMKSAVFVYLGKSKSDSRFINAKPEINYSPSPTFNFSE